jgi:hypothetical protein
MPLVPYTPPVRPAIMLRTLIARVSDACTQSSFSTQLEDRHLHTVYVWSHGDEEVFRTASGDFVQKTEEGLRSPTVRSLVLAGALPSPERNPTLPAPYPHTMGQLLYEMRPGEPCPVSKTIHTTLNQISYNGMQPFNKTAEQLAEGIDFLNTKIDSRNEEETGSTCIGLSHTLIQQLHDKHGIEAMFAVQRKQGQNAFEHAVVIIECSDGYVLLDPRSNFNNRIYPVRFGQSVMMCGQTFTAAGPGSPTPIFQSKPIFQSNDDEEYEYCTNVTNGDDLVTKHFIMESPFDPPQDPAFPVSAYYLKGPKAGRGSRTIFVSPLKAKFTFKNDTLAPEDPERTTVISFQDALQSDFHARLTRFYVAGAPPTFNIKLDSLHEDLVQFVHNAEIINAIFQEIHTNE